MRKRDYFTLAAVFARHYTTARAMSANARARNDADAEHYADGRADAVRSVADGFARECETINRAEFMRACGLEP